MGKRLTVLLDTFLVQFPKNSIQNLDKKSRFQMPFEPFWILKDLQNPKRFSIGHTTIWLPDLSCIVGILIPALNITEPFEYRAKF